MAEYTISVLLCGFWLGVALIFALGGGLAATIPPLIGVAIFATLSYVNRPRKERD